MKNEDIYKSAVAKFGENAEIRMCFEEMSELQKELCKYLRQKEYPRHFPDGESDMFVSGRNNLAGIILALLDVQEVK